MTQIICPCGTANSSFNPRCIACGRRLTELAPPAAKPTSASETEIDEQGVAIGDEYGVWTVQSILGTGTSGTIVAVRHSRDGSLATLKVLSERAGMGRNSRRRFLREAKALTLIKHPHLVRILDVVDDHNPAYIVLDPLPGQSLHEHLRDGPFPPNAVMDILARSRALWVRCT